MALLLSAEVEAQVFISFSCLLRAYVRIKMSLDGHGWLSALSPEAGLKKESTTTLGCRQAGLAPLVRMVRGGLLH